MSVFDPTNRKDSTKSRLFLDEPVTIARYDKQKYPFLAKLTTQQLGFYWQPEEINLVQDQRDFKALTAHEQHIFTSNIKRQILLDSVQGRAPIAAFGPICSLPELESWLLVWSFSELIHSRSYTHIIRNIYPDPSAVFDGIMDIAEIVDCAKEISQHYDDLIQAVSNSYSETDIKKLIWLTLMSVNILEGVRFYVSFACSWAFAELKRMDGNAKIIKFICRDENLHLAGTQQLLQVLPSDDPDFADISQQTQKQAIDMFVQAVDQEKKWAAYLFKDGSMIGLNEQLLSDYIEWIANKRMTAVGLPSPYKRSPANPLPWTMKWISGQEVQVAPQETEITAYRAGDIVKDVDETTFKGFGL
jgi:ribonucleoside-diphosphate reductase beta chain